MPVQVHKIRDRASWLDLRKQDVTASVAGALLGVHEYETAYGLWALKTGQREEETAETGAMRRGRLLEPVALQLLREERPTWGVRNPGLYYRDPEARLGATPDLQATDPERPGFGVVQVKTVAPLIFRNHWRDIDGLVEVPTWIAVQAIVEASLTGAGWAMVMALVIDHDIKAEFIEVPVHAGVIEQVRAKVRAFWDLVESGEQPKPDWGHDQALAARLFRDDGSALDLSGDNALPELIEERARLKGEIKVAEERCDAIDVTIKNKLGLAQTAHLPGWKISFKTQETKAYTVPARTTRPLRITAVQQKEQAA